MLNVISTELLKLKRSKIHWLVLIAALPANLIALFALLPQVGPSGSPVGIDIQALFYRQGQTLTILGPFMFALMTGYIFAREYQERTINQLFSYPISRVKIMCAKLAVIFFMIVITTALSSVTAIIIAFIQLMKQQVGIETIWMGIRMNILACVLFFGTIPVAAALSMIGKSVIPSAVLGVFATVITLIAELGHGMESILFPWTTPYWPIRDLGQGFADMGPNPYASAAVIVLLITFAISFLFCMVYYSKSEVHSGS